MLYPARSWRDEMRHKLVLFWELNSLLFDNLRGPGLVTEPLWAFVSSFTFDDVGPDGL